MNRFREAVRNQEPTVARRRHRVCLPEPADPLHETIQTDLANPHVVAKPRSVVRDQKRAVSQLGDIKSL